MEVYERVQATCLQTSLTQAVVEGKKHDDHMLRLIDNMNYMI